MRAYHDDEWGVPSHDDTHLFEMLILEGAQAGLSWSTILEQARELPARASTASIRERVARYDDDQAGGVCSHDPGIVRNRLKIASAVSNAQAFLVAREGARLVRGLPVGVGRRQADREPARGTMADLPARTELSDRVGKDLKKRGFNFVGSTIVYSYLQAVGAGQRPRRRPARRRRRGA